MNGFRITVLSAAIALAIRADAKAIEENQVAELLCEAVTEQGASMGIDFIPARSMYLAFADFTDKLGRHLGHEIEQEGMALDWAEEYPHLRSACIDVSVCIAQAIGHTEVVDGSAAEVLAALLELEQQRPTIH